MDYVENILRVWNNANASQIEKGMTWYNAAHNLANEIGNGDVWKGAGLIAVYSPLTPWWRNVELATTTAETGIARTDTLSNSAWLAHLIVNGAHPLDVIKGDKTRSFCQNIALNGVSDSCTIDVHAFSIAHAEPIPSSRLTMGKRLYRTISDAYKQAAQMNNVMATQMQAVTWVVWREMHPKKGVIDREA